uniref:uncharacterized protein n=1 Tax=Pristiophorus japonicus TaxID=55135 RepID=UPI00398EF593
MYTKNYRQCPVERAPHSKEMELVYKRCFQSEPAARGQSLHLPRVPDQRQQAKPIPPHKPSSDENAKEQGSAVHPKCVRPVVHIKPTERKDNSYGYGAMKTGRSKVHERENKERTIHDDEKLTAPEKAVKSCSNSSHKSRESSTVYPLPPWTSQQDTSKLLVPDVTPIASSLPGSSLWQKEEKSEVCLKKTPPQTVEKNGQGESSIGQIPVRITARIDGVGRTSGSFIVPQTDPSRGPPVKRQKTEQKMISITPGKMIQGSTGEDMQNLDHRGEEAVSRLTSTDDEISDDDIFREIPEQYRYKASEIKEKTIILFKREPLQPNDASSIDNKKYSPSNIGSIKEASHQSSTDLKSHRVPSTGSRDSKAAKDSHAREPSRSNTISEKDRPKKETHRDARAALILAKRDKLMKIYRLDCELFAMVAKQLVHEDPSIEKQVQLALRRSLHQIGERCLEELKKSIAGYDAVKKSN